ncbi:DUF2442 domain-containing protein [Pantoea sp. Ap-967]|uniref:DUF2442 domain-containing protein n=1 Tax=Pantoea sp. Ap-967 TaxID=2608362 RepID=UPI0019642118|nr:DUF2442 domain-containing protein [Pantoea sp. Ap-967]
MTRKHFMLEDIAVSAPGALLLTFADGERFPVRLDEIIARHPTLHALSMPDVFATAAIGEWKDTVIWADDDNLELAADNLRALAVEQAGDCSHERVWNWMARNELTLDQAAQELGLSRRMLAYYKSGEKPVPRTVALAMKGWDALYAGKAKPRKGNNAMRGEVSSDTPMLMRNASAASASKKRA